jgi:3-isopropylmalate/(R)-2-methylmalate dehydratase small subunit
LTAIFEGRVHKLGDNINTDYIMSSRRKRDTLDLNVLKQYLMEDIDPEFAGRVQAGDILAAGSNFGCGSAMEVASLVVKAAGIRVIVAKSFARTYYRNAINGGILPIEANTDSVSNEDRLRIVVEGSVTTINNLTKNLNLTASAPDGIILDIFENGGLINYIRSNGGFSFK